MVSNSINFIEEQYMTGQLGRSRDRITTPMPVRPTPNLLPKSPRPRIRPDRITTPRLDRKRPKGSQAYPPKPQQVPKPRPLPNPRPRPNFPDNRPPRSPIAPPGPYKRRPINPDDFTLGPYKRRPINPDDDIIKSPYIPPFNPDDGIIKGPYIPPKSPRNPIVPLGRTPTMPKQTKMGGY